MKKKILEAINISKSFPGVLALDQVDIELKSNEVHAVIGENGAGKSTLVKCLTGIYSPSNGDILLNEKDITDNSELLKKVAYVPQEINLFDNLSVAENLFMPFNQTKGEIISLDKMVRDARPILDKFRLKIDPEKLVGKISVSDKQMLQLARALMSEDFEVLILDEPTTSLTNQELDLFYSIINEQKEEGKAIVFISHKLEELFKVSDVISVFRNGKKVGFHSINDVSEEQIVTEMTGKFIDNEKSYHSKNIRENIILEVKNFNGEHFSDVNFSLKTGEILGFSGLVGAGRTELMQAIFGYLPRYSGELYLDGVKIDNNSTTDSVSKGLIYIPEERKAQGIFPHLSVKENISLSLIDKISTSGLINAKLENEVSNSIIKEYSIKTASPDQEIQFLSGGNQQKVIIGRSISSNPKVLIFDEPTKGIDVGTKAEIYRLIQELAQTLDVGIIIISSEIDEVLKCSNRIIVMYEGKIINEFSHPVVEEQLMKSMIGMNG